MNGRPFRHRGRRGLALAAILTLLGGYGLSSPHAAGAVTTTTYTVNTTVDAAYVGPGCVDANGKCSPRAAVTAASKDDAGTGYYWITIPAGTYPLTLGDLTVGIYTIPTHITIAGAGLSKTIIKQTTIGSRVITNYTNTIIQDITITGGNPTLLFTNGAGVWDDGNLSLLRVHITKNVSPTDGGGVYKSAVGSVNTGQEPPLAITDSTIDYNTAVAGGGIYNEGTVTLSNVHVDHNIATGSSGQGGGLWSSNKLSADKSTFSFNVAGGSTANAALICSCGQGGGIYSDGSGLVTNSSLFGNTVGDEGGGAWNDARLTLTNVSVNGNQSGDEGGGLWNDNTLKMTNMTLMSNTAGGPLGGNDGKGGAIFNGFASDGEVSPSTPEPNEQMNGGLLRNNQALGSSERGASVRGAIPVSYGNSEGGAVWSESRDLFINVRFLMNTANDGGAIYHSPFRFFGGSPGSLTLQGSQIVGNRAIDEGGGIFEAFDSEWPAALTTLLDTRVAGNTAYETGGIFNYPNDPSTVQVGGLSAVGANYETDAPPAPNTESDCPNIENPCS